MTAPEPRRRWSFRLAATIGLAAPALVIAGLAWNLTSLRGLPDIGEPFDVASFTSARVRDDENAFVLYRRADALYRPWDGQPTYDWPTASATERKWLDDNREALEIWRQGTERPDASFIPRGESTFDADLDLVKRLRGLVKLACFRASQLEAEGDFEGAWTWYRAALRASRHCGRQGNLIERLIGIAIHGQVAQEITAWAGSPRVDAGMLRKALAEVQAIDAMTAPMSYTIKCEYLALLEATGRPGMLWALLEREARDPNSPEGDGWTFARTALLRARGFLRRDPVRSRRLFKLMVANWLVYCDRPLEDRPPFEADSRLVYVSDSSAPPAARMLSPGLMNSWYESTIVLHTLFPAYDATRRAVDRERAAQSALVVHLASELYRREHGGPPASPEVLVGPYLKALTPAAVPK